MSVFGSISYVRIQICSFLLENSSKHLYMSFPHCRSAPLVPTRHTLVKSLRRHEPCALIHPIHIYYLQAIDLNVDDENKKSKPYKSI